MLADEARVVVPVVPEPEVVPLAEVVVEPFTPECEVRVRKGGERVGQALEPRDEPVPGPKVELDESAEYRDGSSRMAGPAMVVSSESEPFDEVRTT